MSTAFLAGAVWGDTLDVARFPHCVTIQFSGYASETPLEHFPVLVKLAEGQPVGFSYAACAADSFRFTDVDGNRFAYQVVVRETLEPTAIDEMQSEEDGAWDLTLFTCTIGGQSRVTVRCVQVEEP